MFKRYFLISGISPLDMLASAAEIQYLKVEIDQKKSDNRRTKKWHTGKRLAFTELESEAKNKTKLSVKSVLQRTAIKGLFKYYTGITYLRFMALLRFFSSWWIYTYIWIRKKRYQWYFTRRLFIFSSLSNAS